MLYVDKTEKKEMTKLKSRDTKHYENNWQFNKTMDLSTKPMAPLKEQKVRCWRVFIPDLCFGNWEGLQDLTSMMVPDHLNANQAINPQTAGLSLRPRQARLDPRFDLHWKCQLDGLHPGDSQDKTPSA